MRRLILFPCEGAMLAGTLDQAIGGTGLLIVSGGNELRVGAHRGMTLLAAQVAAAGCPVFRFDRRGVGDSEGENGGWASSAPDIAAALAAFWQEQPHLRRVVALGNCDAATALACFGQSAGVDALLLTNPWTGGDTDGLPPAPAIRQHYGRQLRDPRVWWRALTGAVDLRKLASGIAKLNRPAVQDVAGRVLREFERFAGPITIVLASNDATAIGFRSCWQASRSSAMRDRARLVEIATASHSFQRPADRAALHAIVLAALADPRSA